MKKNLKRINWLNIYIIYFIYIFFIICGTIYYSNLFIIKFPWLIDDTNSIIIKKIPFGYGNLIENLIFKEEYYTDKWIEGKMYLARLPVLPIFLSVIFYFSTNIYFFLITKNIIIFSLYFFLVSIFVRKDNSKKNFLILLFLILYNPYNLSIIFNFVYADFIIAILIPCLFITFIAECKLRSYIISLILFILYLTKTSMFFLTLLISLVFYFLEKDKKKNIVIISVLCAILVWGFFGLTKTNKFPFGQSLISINSWGMSHVLNDSFYEFYPKKSVDRIVFEDKNKNFYNEWEFYEYYKKKNEDYFANNIGKFINNCLIKVKFIFFYINYDNVNEGEDFKSKKILYSSIDNRFFFNLSLIILIINFYNSFKIKVFNKIDLYFFFLVLFYCIPLIIGWATNKHLVGIFIVSKIYIFYKYLLYKNNLVNKPLYQVKEK